MPLDPVVQTLVDNARAAGRSVSLAQGSVEDARRAYELVAHLGGEQPELASVEDRVLEGPGGDLRVRVYTARAERTPLPVVAYFHGGGWTIGSVESHDPLCRQLAAQAGVIVVSPEYRLAPEHPFPAAVDDAVAVVDWLGAKADDLGGDPSRLAVAGDSAGGNLATVACIAARQAGGPPLAFQLLIYPSTDGRGGYRSHEENADGPFLTAETMEWFRDQYSTDDAARHDWRMSPISLDDMSRLPPAFVLTAEYDPLRDEGEAYAARLQAAGVPVTLRRYEGQPHMFVQLLAILPAAREAVAECAAALREALSA